MVDSNLTIEQMYNEIATIYCSGDHPALNVCTDILDRFGLLGARTVKDIWRMLDRLEEVL